MKNQIEIDGEPYVLQSSLKCPERDGMKYVVVRSKDSGVHAGYLKSQDGDTVNLVDARRIWYWKGAASLSQLAMEGTSAPDECKFPAPVLAIQILGVCEVIDTTERARESIQGVTSWKK